MPHSYRSGKPERSPIRRCACDHDACWGTEKDKAGAVQAVQQGMGALGRTVSDCAEKGPWRRIPLRSAAIKVEWGSFLGQKVRSRRRERARLSSKRPPVPALQYSPFLLNLSTCTVLLESHG